MIETIVGFFLGHRSGIKRQHRAALQQGEAELALRVVQGSVKGLSDQWLLAKWSVDEGVLRRSDLEIVVNGFLGERNASFRELYGSLPLDPVILRLDSKGAIVECGVLDVISDDLVKRLLGQRGET